MQIKKLTDLDLKNQRVLIREDLNVPIKNKIVTSDARLQAALPTIKWALQAGAKVLLMSHLGRPLEGADVASNAHFSLQPIADYLSKALAQTVPLISDYLHTPPQLDAGQIVLLENVRFNVGENDNNDALAKVYASLCDIFVMDAFGTAHRAQASTHGVAKFAPIAAAGPLLVDELENLQRALSNPRRPLVAIVGGAKVSTKLAVLENLARKVDQLIVGGGIANTFLAAAHKPIGSSLCEESLIPQARKIMQHTQIPLPVDVVVGTEFSENTSAQLKQVDAVQAQDMIFDIGPQSSAQLQEIIAGAGTIIWNGPLGVFEFPQFAQGTEALAIAIAASNAFSIAGGGDTLAAVDKFGVADKISYISTGGGAFLEYVEGKLLPAVAILQQRASD